MPHLCSVPHCSKSPVYTLVKSEQLDSPQLLSDLCFYLLMIPFALSLDVSIHYLYGVFGSSKLIFLFSEIRIYPFCISSSDSIIFVVLYMLVFFSCFAYY